MDYQFVFGNPTRGLAKKKNPSKMKRKGKSSMKKKKKKVAKRSNPKRRIKRRKNPMRVVATTPKGKKIKGKKWAYTVAERAQVLKKYRKALEDLNVGPLQPKKRKALEGKRKRASAMANSQAGRLKAMDKEKAKFEAKGYTVTTEEYVKNKKRKGRKKVARKKAKSRSKKKKVMSMPKGYKKWPKKGIKMSKKLRRAKRRKTAAKYAVKGKKGWRKYSLRRNPGLLTLAPAKTQIETYVGDVTELTSLLLGGLSYGLVQQTALKFFPGIYKFAKMIPGGDVVGPAFPTIVIGVLAHKIGDMQNINALKLVGRGLLGASVVGMAMKAATKVMPMAGIPEGLGEEADFEGVQAFDGLGEEADFEGVQAFDGIPEGLGYEHVSLGEADFEGVQAFDGIPEGLGYGQLG